MLRDYGFTKTAQFYKTVATCFVLSQGAFLTGNGEIQGHPFNKN